MNLNLGGLEKKKDLLYIIATIVLIIVVYYVLKKSLGGVKDFIDFGFNSEEKKKAVEKNENRIKQIPVNTKNLKYTIKTYENWADMIHAELLNETWLKPVNMSLVRGVFRNINTIDGLNQLKKSFGVRENMDLFQYLREKLTSLYKDPLNIRIKEINDIFKSKGNLKNIKI